MERTIEYDIENRITGINDDGSITTFAYNAGRGRIKKSGDNVVTYYFFGHYEEKMEQGILKTINYYFANGQRIAQRTTTGSDTELLYFHTDHLGSAVRLTDEDGTIIQSTVYDPYGMTVYSSGTGSTSYQFTGQKLDEEFF